MGVGFLRLHRSARGHAHPRSTADGTETVGAARGSPRTDLELDRGGLCRFRQRGASGPEWIDGYRGLQRGGGDEEKPSHSEALMGDVSA